MIDDVFELPVAIRLAGPADLGFIYSAWINSFRDSELARVDGRAAYYAVQRRRIERIRVRPRACIRIACAATDPVNTLGFVCTEPGIVHYVYVKEHFRCMGIATKLLEGVRPPIRYSHFLTRDMRAPSGWTRDLESMFFGDAP